MTLHLLPQEEPFVCAVLVGKSNRFINQWMAGATRLLDLFSREGVFLPASSGAVVWIDMACISNMEMVGKFGIKKGTFGKNLMTWTSRVLAGVLCIWRVTVVPVRVVWSAGPPHLSFLVSSSTNV